MIVCVCRRLNETAVNAAIERGARSPECVQAHHGATFNCGRCRPVIGEMIARRVEQTTCAHDLKAAE